jgi:hypothetical protein
VSRVAWIVIVGLIVIMGGIAIAMEKKETTKPKQEASRLLRVPTDRERRVIVPPCGTGTNVAATKADVLVKTPGTIAFRLQKETGERLVLIPRCRASQGAAPSEGVNLPSAAFILPIGAQVTAGRGGSAQAGTELVESQIAIFANSPVDTVVITRCIQSAKEAEKHASGRTIVIKGERGDPKVALAPPC